MHSATVIDDRQDHLSFPDSQRGAATELLMEWPFFWDLNQEHQLPPPHTIPRIHEDEEFLLPLDDPIMHRIPPLDDQEHDLMLHLLPLNDQELGLNVVALRNQHVQVADPAESSLWSFLHQPDDWRPWPVSYEEMRYEGTEDENEEVWNLQQHANSDSDETIDQEGDPITITAEEDTFTTLLQSIDNQSAQYIATISLHEPVMSDPDRAPMFGSALEPVRPHQQKHEPHDLIQESGEDRVDND